MTDVFDATVRFLLRGRYDRGFTREDVVALFHILDGLMRMPAELEQQLWRALQAEEAARPMQYASSVQWIGRQEGLDAERQLLLRQVRRRFGETVAADRAPSLARIAVPVVLAARANEG